MGTAQAGPLDNTPFVSMYGGYQFADTDSSIEFLPGGVGEFVPIGELDFGDQSGFAGMAVGGPLNALWDVRTSFNAFWLNGDDGSAASSPTDFGDAETDFSYQYFDLELGYRPGVLAKNIRLFAGPRLLRAATDVEYNEAFADPPFGTKTGSYEHDIDLYGVGGRIGAETAMPLGGSRTSLSLLGAGSALAAYQDHNFEFATTSILGGDTGFDGEEEWRGVYNLEAVAAINFALSDRASFQLGYRVENWWNLTTTLEGVDAILEEIGETSEGDLFSHGPTARFTVQLGGAPPP